MKASVVIRTLNCEGTIGKVLEGVRDQSFEDYEIVICDSGSTDGTLGIIRRYPHTFVDYSGGKFTYGGSLNAACKAARGEYVVCLSHHSIPLHDGWLARLVEALDDNESLAGAWGPLIFDLESYPVGKKGVEEIDLEKFYKRPNWGLQNPNSIVRRSLWEERPFSEKLERCEDQDWIHHFLIKGYRSATVHEAPVLYAPEFGFYKYAVSNYKNSLALEEMFGYRGWGLSTAQFGRLAARSAGAAVAGKRSPQVARLAISSMAGRWAADKVVGYRENPGKLCRDEAAEIARLALETARQTRRSLGKTRRRLLKASQPQRPEMIRFFLAGEMRSGTSWLSRALDSHPGIFCKGEGSFFGRDQSVEEIPVYKGPTPSLSNALFSGDGFHTWHSLMWNGWGREDEEEEDRRNITRLAVDYFLAKDSAASGKRIVGDKSPLHTDHVDEIFALYPEAKVVHIYRDGRDVAVSLMHHFWRMAKDNGGIFELEPEEIAKRDAYLEEPEAFLSSGESIFTEERLRQISARWVRRVRKASRDGVGSPSSPGSGFFQLSYEEFLENPEESLGRLFRFLGARADDEIVRRCVERSSFEQLAGRSKGQEDPGSFFRKGVAGDWRDVFTDRDREIFEEVAGDALTGMGYPID